MLERQHFSMEGNNTARGRGKGVSKEIGGSVRLLVWRHVSRRWLLKWRAKCSSKRRIKISNLSRKYCSDFLDLEIFRSLLSYKNRLWYFFGMKRSVVLWIVKISFYRRANLRAIIPNCHTLRASRHKMKECWHNNKRFIKWKYIIQSSPDNSNPR